MPQFPDWKRQAAAWTDAAQLRRAQLLHVLSDLVAQARGTTGELTGWALEVARQTRGRCERLPRTLVDGLRGRVNVLDLATKRDVELQSRLGRKRTYAVLQEFVDAQRDHDAQLLESLRSELREELQSFAAAIDDDLFEVDHGRIPLQLEAAQRLDAEFDDFDDEDMIDIDLTSYEASVAIDDDERDIVDDETGLRHSETF
ncbi:MAG: hypothetical protein ACT4OX_15070 [Actinomycetota bacterium]